MEIITPILDLLYFFFAGYGVAAFWEDVETGIKKRRRMRRFKEDTKTGRRN